MEPIINEAGLKADMVEGLADYLKISLGTAKEYITEDEVEKCLATMLQVEADYIKNLGIEIVEGK